MTGRLLTVSLDDSGLPVPTPEVEQERQLALYDLIEENRFSLVAQPGGGPYRLSLAVRDRRLVFSVTVEDGSLAGEFHLALSPFRDIIRDYFRICESYFDAVKRLPASQIEAIDMGRRGIHNEGARILQERLSGKIETDAATARRLFTLICVLHFKG